ncbi:MAG: hypothetical protein OEQ39_11075, partial [Gammaproteobacteria bacterium]|nr:hypothetical protein [Gammaproteobacteria bacterium]
MTRRHNHESRGGQTVTDPTSDTESSHNHRRDTAMGDQRRSRNRGSARDARRAARAKPQLERIPYITRRIPVYELASDELLELV